MSMSLFYTNMEVYTIIGMVSYNTERYQWQLAKLSPDEFYGFITTGIYPLPCAVPEGYPGGSAP